MSEYIFKLPDLGEGTVEAEIAEWMVKVGDTVKEEDPICAMLTDKAAVELTAPVSGTVTAVAGEEGDTVSVGTPLIVFRTGESAQAPVAADLPNDPLPTDQSSAKAVEQPAAEPPPSKPDPTEQTGKVLTSPSIRARAREAGVNLARVPGSGPRGRILKSDFDHYLSGDERGPGAPAAATPQTATREIKVIGLRRKIAERMAQATREIPHFTYVEEIDLTALESLRAHLNGKKTPGEARLTPLPFIGMALIRAVKEFPQCNARYDSERNVIVQHQGVHLGIATQTADGLKVPVVKHAETLTLEKLAAEIRRVSEAARDNTASRDELGGSTITITSLGKLGGIVSTPVINQPEVGIIGVNKAVERPVAVNGQLLVRTMMNLSSSFDHRFVDGYDAAAMVQRIRELLEQPATLFMP